MYRAGQLPGIASIISGELQGGGNSICLCTGGTYYVTYSFRFISNKSWDGGEGRGVSLNRPIVGGGRVQEGGYSYLIHHMGD
jgi:hypothetical protein